MRACMSVCMHACMHACMHVHVNVCMHVHVVLYYVARGAAMPVVSCDASLCNAMIC